MHEGFAGNLGEPKASSGHVEPEEQRVRPVEQTPWRQSGDFPELASENWKST